jgi:septal ring factor EnvC (AmiA/AmiB activator)
VRSQKKVELKPFSNFSVFHDNLIAKLKALSQIQLDFEKRCKEAEGRYSDKLADLKKQIDNRWRQIDKFESSLKTIADTKLAWKRKFSLKEGEIEALKVRVANSKLCGTRIYELFYLGEQHRTLRSSILPPSTCRWRSLRDQITPSPSRQRRAPTCERTESVACH